MLVLLFAVVVDMFIFIFCAEAIRLAPTRDAITTTASPRTIL